MVQVGGKAPTAVLPGRPEAAVAVWDWKGEREAADASSTRRSQRRHGLIQAIVGALLGTLVFFFWHTWLSYLIWSVSGLMLIAALTSPDGLYARIQKVASGLGVQAGRLVSLVLLVPLFYGFFAVFGRIFRGGRRDRLERWFDREAPSYWKRRNDQDRGLSSYERQF